MAVYGLDADIAEFVMSSRAQIVGISDDAMAQGVIDAATSLFDTPALRQQATDALDQIGIEPAA